MPLPGDLGTDAVNDTHILPIGELCHNAGCSGSPSNKCTCSKVELSPCTPGTTREQLDGTQLTTQLSSQGRELSRCHNPKEEKDRLVRMEGLLGGRKQTLNTGQQHTEIKELGLSLLNWGPGRGHCQCKGHLHPRPREEEAGESVRWRLSAPECIWLL